MFSILKKWCFSNICDVTILKQKKGQREYPIVLVSILKKCMYEPNKQNINSTPCILLFGFAFNSITFLYEILVFPIPPKEFRIPNILFLEIFCYFVTLFLALYINTTWAYRNIPPDDSLAIIWFWGGGWWFWLFLESVTFTKCLQCLKFFHIWFLLFPFPNSYRSLKIAK